MVVVVDLRVVVGLGVVVVVFVVLVIAINGLTVVDVVVAPAPVLQMTFVA